MNYLLAFFNQPIVITLVTLAIGGYLLDVITERRARTNKLRDEAVAFIIEVSNYIGKFMPLIYKQLRTGSLEVDQDISAGMIELFSKRISIQIGSQAFLKSEDFYRRYHQLLDHLMGVVTCMNELNQEGPVDEVVTKIQRRGRGLVEAWPLADESLQAGSGQAIDELILWMDIIAHRVTHLLSTHLKQALH